MGPVCVNRPLSAYRLQSVYYWRTWRVIAVGPLQGRAVGTDMVTEIGVRAAEAVTVVAAVVDTVKVMVDMVGMEVTVGPIMVKVGVTEVRVVAIVAMVVNVLTPTVVVPPTVVVVTAEYRPLLQHWGRGRLPSQPASPMSALSVNKNPRCAPLQACLVSVGHPVMLSKSVMRESPVGALLLDNT